MFILDIMAERKKVRFTNTTGKPLVTVREINAVGRGTKLTPLVRKSMPADLKKMKAKHEAAVRRAMADVSRAEDNLNKVKKVATSVQNIQYLAKMKMVKEKNPSNNKHLQEKINKMNNMKKKLAPKLEMLQIDLNTKKNKLKAQRAHGMKRSRFSFM